MDTVTWVEGRLHSPSAKGEADLSKPGAWEAVTWLDKKRGDRQEGGKQPGLHAKLSGEERWWQQQAAGLSLQSSAPQLPPVPLLLRLLLFACHQGTEGKRTETPRREEVVHSATLQLLKDKTEGTSCTS